MGGKAGGGQNFQIGIRKQQKPEQDAATRALEKREREEREAEEATKRNLRASRGGRVALVSEDEAGTKLGV